MISIFYIAYLVCVSSYSTPRSISERSLNPNNQSLISHNTGVEQLFEVKTNQGRYATNKDTIPEKKISLDEMLEKTKLDPEAILRRAWVKLQNKHLSVFQLYSDGNCEEMDWYPLRSRVKKEPVGEYSEGAAYLKYKVVGNQCRDHKYFGLPSSMVELPSWFHAGVKFQKTKEKADVMKWSNLGEKESNHTVTRRQMYRAFLNEAYRFKDEEKYMCSNFGNNVAKFMTGRKPLNTKMMMAVNEMAAKAHFIEKEDEKPASTATCYEDLLGRGTHCVEEEDEASSLTGGNFCGLPEDAIEAYLTPPAIVEDFISFAFGTTFGIGKLKDHDSDSCGEIATIIGDDLDVAWINIDESKGLDLLTEAAEENFQKCKRKRGSDNKNCKKSEKKAVTEEDEAEGEILPICAAFRPCAADNTRLLTEGTFAIHFAGNGIPVAKVYGIQLGVISLAFSSTGDLKTDGLIGDPEDDDTLTLLDVVPHTSMGMHLWIKGSFSFPVCKIKGKDVLTLEGTLGVGIFGMITLQSGQEIKSPAELIVYFLEMGGDLSQMTNQENAIKALDFELNGAVEGEIGLDLGNLFPKSNLGSLSFTVEDRLLIQLHVEQNANSLQIWNSFRVSTDLKDLLKIVPFFADLVPSVAIEVTNKVYVGVKEPFETDFILSFEASLSIDCGPLDDIVLLFVGVLEGIFQQDLEDLRWFVNSICSGTIKLGFQIRKKDWGLDAEETFLSFQDHKLRLSHLPICYTPENGVKPSPYSIETAHSYNVAKCSGNADCTYDGKSGYCLNHPQLKTVFNCQGRCIQKIPSGGSCSDQRLNLLVETLDPFAAEHAACESNQCWRGVCTTIINGKNLMADGGPCGGETECHSGWCEGSTTEVAGGNGVCRAKRKNGEPSWYDWQASCESGKSQCGTCTANYEDLENGKSCSGWAQCTSHWCEGSGGTGCWGTCQAKRANGVKAWRDWRGAWRESCSSGREQCGYCTRGSRDLPRNAPCSSSNNCASNWCNGWFVADCNGSCD